MTRPEDADVVAGLAARVQRLEERLDLRDRIREKLTAARGRTVGGKPVFDVWGFRTDGNTGGERFLIIAAVVEAEMNPPGWVHYRLPGSADGSIPGGEGFLRVGDDATQVEIERAGPG